jgi:hypothetical protein
MAKNNDKQRARELWDASRATFASGDYRRTRELDAQVAELAPDSEQGRLARREREAFGLDRRVLIAGVGTVVLYALAWLVAFW